MHEYISHKIIVICLFVIWNGRWKTEIRVIEVISFIFLEFFCFVLFLLFICEYASEITYNSGNLRLTFIRIAYDDFANIFRTKEEKNSNRIIFFFYSCDIWIWIFWIHFEILSIRVSKSSKTEWKEEKKINFYVNMWWTMVIIIQFSKPFYILHFIENWNRHKKKFILFLECISDQNEWHIFSWT